MMASAKKDKGLSTFARNQKGQIITERTVDLPHDNLAEEVVLGQASYSLSSFERARAGGLKPEHFWVEKHQEVWNAIVTVVDRDRDVSPLSVASQLRQSFGWDEAQAVKSLANYAKGWETAQFGESPARIVLDFAGKRDAIAFARSLGEAAANGRSTTDLLKATELWVAEQEIRTPLKFELQGPKPLNLYGDFKPIAWVVGDERSGLMPAGYPTLLAADGGSGKSYLALTLALIAANGGGDWLGFPVKGGPALYLDFELDARVASQRAERVALGLWGTSTLPDDFHYIAVREEGLSLTDTAIKLQQWIKDFGYVLVVIDSLSIAMADDPSNPQAVIDLLNRKLKYLSKTDAALLFLDHKPKPQPGHGDVERGAFGSVFKRNVSRSVLLGSSEKRDEWSRHLTFVHNKANFGPELDPFGALITWHDDHRVTVELAPASIAVDTGPKLSENSIRILQHLVSDGLTRSNTQIAESTSIGKGSVATLLSRLEEAGYVEKVGRGAWKATSHAFSFLGIDEGEATENADGVDRLLQQAFGDDDEGEEEAERA